MKKNISFVILALGVILTLTSMSSNNSIEKEFEIATIKFEQLAAVAEPVCVGNWCCTDTYCCNLQCDFGRCCFPIEDEE